MEFTELYSNRILEIVANSPDRPRLQTPDASARKVSRVCGSVIEVDLKIGPDGRIADYGADVDACALGQTSAAIVAAHIDGASPQEMRDLRDQMVAMLKADGPPPGGQWDDLKYLEPVRSYPSRQTSTLLVFEAVVAALDRIDAKKGAA